MNMQGTLNFTPEAKVNPTEAPAGFCAVLKSNFGVGDNICNHCDWRKWCCDPATDLVDYGHRCMAVAVRLENGKLHQRLDGCSVMFKKLPVSE